jgi:hypothetical protein
LTQLNHAPNEYRESLLWCRSPEQQSGQPTEQRGGLGKQPAFACVCLSGGQGRVSVRLSPPVCQSVHPIHLANPVHCTTLPFSLRFHPPPNPHVASQRNAARARFPKPQPRKPASVIRRRPSANRLSDPPCNALRHGAAVLRCAALHSAPQRSRCRP